MSLQVLRELRSGPAVLRQLKGILDEDLSVSVLGQADARVLALDLSLVSGVSAEGVKQWINGIQQVAERLDALYYVAASPRVTDQLNLIVSFAGRGKLLSFSAGYECQECDNNTPILFDCIADRQLIRSLTAPVRSCRACGASVRYEDSPEMLFEFARHQPTPELLPEVEEVLQNQQVWLPRSPGERLSLRRKVRKKSTNPIISLGGVLDDAFEPERLTQMCQGVKAAWLSLGGLEHVNPSGFGVMARALRSLDEGPAQFALADCTPVFLRHCLDHPQLAGGLRVGSVRFVGQCNACASIMTGVALTSQEGKSPDLGACAQCGTGKVLPLCEPRIVEELWNWARLDVAQRKAQAKTAKQETEPPKTASALERARQAEDRKRRADPRLESEEFNERYEVLARLGSGGMADVYLGRQRGAGGFRRVMVIKLTKNEHLADDRRIRLFLEEARLAANIDHPNVVRVNDVGRTSASYYMALDFIHGRSLEEVLGLTRLIDATIPTPVVVDVMRQTAQGLIAIHQPIGPDRILVHRDLTPANIIVRFDGVAKIIDLGLAGYQQVEQMNAAQTVVASVPYAAPEILKKEEASVESDIWSFGVVMATLLIGRNPFARRSLEECARAILMEEPKLPTTLPKVLVPIIKKCLQKNRGQRYRVVEELDEDLGAASASLRKSGAGWSRLFSRSKSKERTSIATAEWVGQLFSHQVRLENEFVERCGAVNLTEAFLNTSPDEIARFLRAQRLQKESTQTISLRSVSMEFPAL